MNVTARIAELREQLIEGTSPYERLPLLDELSFHLRLIDPEEGEKYGREELRIATSIGDKHWMMRSYIRLGNSVFGCSRYSMARRYFRKAWHLLQELPDDPAEKAYVSRNIANIFFETGQTTDAVEMYETSLHFAKESKDQSEIASTFDAMSRAYVGMGLYSKGLTLRRGALEIFEEASFEGGIGGSLSEIGTIYWHLEDWEQALDYLNKGLAIHREFGNRNAEAHSYLRIAGVYSYQHRFDEAMRLCGQGLELSEKLGEPFLVAHSYLQSGHVLIKQGEYEQAFSYLKKAEETFEAIDNGLGKGLVLLERGEAFSAMKEWEQAIAVLLDSREILSEAKLDSFRIQLEQILANAYEQSRDLEKSLYHYKCFMELERTLLNNEVRHQLAFYQFRDRIRSIEDANERYREKTDRLEREVDERSREVTALSLRIGQDDELLKQLRRRLHELKRSNSQTVAQINTLIREIDDRNDRTNAWHIFKRELEVLDGEFVHSLTSRYESLTKSEIRICLLLKLNMSNKEIGSLLSVSERTVDTHRANIRKKLGLPAQANLVAALSKL